MTHTKDEALKLARNCGATTYTNRHYPDATAVTFSPLAWEKFCEQALAAPVQPVGNWAWSWLMDWCKRNGIAPATQNSLFAMVKDARSKFDTTKPAAQPAPAETDLMACWVEMPDGTIDGIASMRLALSKYGTAAQPAQPAVPDAITDIGENPDYRAGWNECRETMLQILKARTS